MDGYEEEGREARSSKVRGVVKEGGKEVKGGNRKDVKAIGMMHEKQIRET